MLCIAGSMSYMHTRHVGVPFGNCSKWLIQPCGQGLGMTAGRLLSPTLLTPNQLAAYRDGGSRGVAVLLYCIVNGTQVGAPPACLPVYLIAQHGMSAFTQ